MRSSASTCIWRLLGKPLAVSLTALLVAGSAPVTGALGPGPGWNGAALSGGAPPVDPPRTTAKPAVQWWQPSECRFTGDVTIGVDADALGGVAFVDFWGEGATRRCYQELLVDTDVNGNARARLGFFVVLDSAAWKAISTTGEGRIFATAYPNDPTMQARTIGYVKDTTVTGSISGTTLTVTAITAGEKVFPGQNITWSGHTTGPTIVSQLTGTTNGVGTYQLSSSNTASSQTLNLRAWNGDRVMKVFPRTSAYDVRVTVADTAVDARTNRTTLDAAIAYLKTQSAQAGEIEVYKPGYHELSTVGTHYAGAKGFHVVKAASGVSITIGRATPVFGTTSPSLQYINPGLEHMELRGNNVTLDFRNFSTLGINTYGKSFRLNGINVTNSIGTRDSLYWNNGTGPENQFAVPGYIEDCTITYVNVTWHQLMVCGNKIYKTIGHILSDVHFAANNYIKDCTAAYFRTPTTGGCMTIAYVGTGVGTITKTGSNDSQGSQLILRKDGVAVSGGTFTLGYLSNDQYYDSAVLAAAVDALADWTAVSLNNTRRSTSLMGHGFGDTNGFTNQVVTSGGVQLDDWFDAHCQINQFRTDGGEGVRENMLQRGNTLPDIGASVGGSSNSGMLLSSNDSHMRDILQVANIFADGGSAGQARVGADSNTTSHVVYKNCVIEPGIALQGNATVDSYCRYEQCVVGLIGWNTASGPTPQRFKDCYIGYGFQGPDAWSAAPNTGNTLTPIASFNMATLFTAPASNDYRPKVAGPLALNTKASLSAYDGRNLPRAANDAMGAWALGQAAPSWPF